MNNSVAKLTGRYAIVLTDIDHHRFRKGTIVVELYDKVDWCSREYWWQDIKDIDNADITIGSQAMCDCDLLIIGGGYVRYK